MRSARGLPPVIIIKAHGKMNKINFEHPRDQIVEIMRRIYGYGMTTTSGGNLSILDSDGNMLSVRVTVI